MDTNSPSKRARRENTVANKSLKHFKESVEENVGGIPKSIYECKYCGANINGQRNWNLASHLRNIHPEIYNQISTPRKESILVKRLKLLQNLVEMVAINGRVFKAITDSGFISIIQNKLNKMTAAGCSLNLHDGHLTEVKNHLHGMANQVKSKITEEVRGRPLSLLIDIVTKNHRSIFGASIQYIVNGQLKVRSIGMIELLESHTAKYLADLIIARLKMYDIDLKQIITITTDNGANVLKMVRDIDAILQHAISNSTSELQHLTDSPCKATMSSANSIQTEIDDQLTDDAIMNLLGEIDGTTDNDALEILFDDVLLKEHENLLAAMSRQMAAESEFEILYDITGVNCAAHTLQLAVKDALKKIMRKHINVISLCRQIAKLLRLRSTHNEMNGFGINYKSPRLDVETRWSSTYMMV